MLTTNILLSTMLGGALALAIWSAWRNHKRYQLNMHVSNELDTILKSSYAAVTKNKKLHEKTSKMPDLTSPVMLTTLLTVIVHKLGEMRLSLDDFIDVPVDEYISVYVDINSQDLILSLDHALAIDGDDPIAMAPFVPPDDNTFH